MADGHKMQIERRNGRLLVTCPVTACTRKADFVDHPSSVPDAEQVARLHEKATRT
jgi:hypothetical protein